MKNSQSEASARYNAKNVKQIKLNLNRKTDADIIARLEGIGNKQGYIKELEAMGKLKTITVQFDFDPMHTV